MFDANDRCLGCREHVENHGWCYERQMSTCWTYSCNQFDPRHEICEVAL